MKKSVKDVISVIVPIYNVEKYLTQCIESILQQTYTELEIILVDDGSTDSCPKICDFYAEKDKRIKVIHKENGGLADARNAGIRLATGSFITFVDSDDYIDTDMYYLLMKAIKGENADIAIAKCQAFAGEKVTKIATDNEELVLNGKEVLEFLILGWAGYTISPAVWNRIYKRELIEGLQFPKGKCYEDLVWTTMVFERAAKGIYLNRVLYFYRQREDSITKTDFSEKQGVATRILTDQIPQLEAQIGYLKQIERPDLADECVYHLYEIMLKYYCTVFFNRNNEAKSYFLDKIKTYRKWAKQYSKKDIGLMRKFVLWGSIYIRSIVTAAFAIWMKIRRRKC